MKIIKFVCIISLTPAIKYITDSHTESVSQNADIYFLRIFFFFVPQSLKTPIIDVFARLLSSAAKTATDISLSYFDSELHPSGVSNVSPNSRNRGRLLIERHLQERREYLINVNDQSYWIQQMYWGTYAFERLLLFKNRSKFFVRDFAVQDSVPF